MGVKYLPYTEGRT